MLCFPPIHAIPISKKTCAADSHVHHSCVGKLFLSFDHVRIRINTVFRYSYVSQITSRHFIGKIK